MVALGVVGRDQVTYDARCPRGLGEPVADPPREMDSMHFKPMKERLTAH